jgi:hypothetical protein
MPSPVATNFLSEFQDNPFCGRLTFDTCHATMGVRWSSMRFGAMPNVNGK